MVISAIHTHSFFHFTHFGADEKFRLEEGAENLIIFVQCPF